MLAKPRTALDSRLFHVVEVLVSRNLKVRYRGSPLGIVWSALNPVGMACVYAAIFGRTFSPYYGGSVLDYGAAVYIGLSLVGFFIGATTQALPSIVDNRGLLNKIRMPFAAFPVSVLFAYGFQQLVGTLPILIVLTLVVNHDIVHVLLLAVPIVSLALFSTGIALIVSGGDVFFRDIPYLYELTTFLLWVTSPVFYPAAIVPARLAQFLIFNPMYPIIETARQLVLSSALPNAQLCALALAESLVTFALGVVAFRLMQPHFMERV